MVWIQDFDAVRKASNKRQGKSDNVDYGYGIFGDPLGINRKINKKVKDKIMGGSPELKESRKKLNQAIAEYKKVYNELLKTPNPNKTGNFTKKDLLELGFPEYEKKIGISMAGLGMSLPTFDAPINLIPTSIGSEAEEIEMNNSEMDFLHRRSSRMNNLSTPRPRIPSQLPSHDPNLFTDSRFLFASQGGISYASRFRRLLEQLMNDKNHEALRFNEDEIKKIMKEKLCTT